MRKTQLLFILVLSAVSLLRSPLQAQTIFDIPGRRNIGNALMLQLGYGAHMPGGDLAARFGNSFSPEVGLGYFLENGNWIIGASWQYYFGSTVKEDVLQGLRTAEGIIIGNDRAPAEIGLRQRGFYAGGQLGKVIALSPVNPRSGLRIQLGAGLLQHKIRVQKDPLRAVPQTAGDYAKGYDRLSNGLALQQFIGYHIMSNDGRINFYCGFEFSQAFTRNRRDFDFATLQVDRVERFDTLWGLRAGWVLPFYLGKSASEIFY
jgi:hypothetical protein